MSFTYIQFFLSFSHSFARTHTRVSVVLIAGTLQYIHPETLEVEAVASWQVAGK